MKSGLRSMDYDEEVVDSSEIGSTLAQRGQRWIATIPVVARLRLDDLGGVRPCQDFREHPTFSLGKLAAQCRHATTHLSLPLGSIHLGRPPLLPCRCRSTSAKQLVDRSAIMYFAYRSAMAVRG